MCYMWATVHIIATKTYGIYKIRSPQQRTNILISAHPPKICALKMYQKTEGRKGGK